MRSTLALTGIGRAHRTLGNQVLAREHYQHALAIYADLGMPEADQLRTDLVAIGPAPRGRGQVASATRTT